MITHIESLVFKKTARICLYLFALVLLVSCGAEEQSYFPLDNNWQYIYSTETTMPDSQMHGSYSVTNLGKKQYAGGSAFVRRNNVGTHYYFSQDEVSGDVARIAKRTSAEQRPIADTEPRYVFKHPFSEQLQWLVPARSYLMSRPFSTEYELKDTLRFDMNYQVLSTSETVQVPLGRYQNCLHIRGVANFMLGRILTVIQDPVEIITDEWYAKGIGLIKLQRKEVVDSKYANGGQFQMQLSAIK